MAQLQRLSLPGRDGTALADMASSMLATTPAHPTHPPPRTTGILHKRRLAALPALPCRAVHTRPTCVRRSTFSNGGPSRAFMTPSRLPLFMLSLRNLGW